jgi:hypothetical protein
MEKLIPWNLLLTVIEHHYPKASNGRKPYPLESLNVNLVIGKHDIEELQKSDNKLAVLFALPNIYRLSQFFTLEHNMEY